MDKRVIRVFPHSRSWICECPEDWDEMSQEDRDQYVYDVAIENDKLTYDYKAEPSS